jgi:glucan phosphoethanolaminetransferase (alkaline phosphatase superfamily)
LAAVPFLLVTFGGGLGGLIGLIAVWINVRLIRKSWHWLVRLAVTLGVTLLAVALWFLIYLLVTSS